MGCVGSKTPDHSPLASPGKKSPHKKGGGGASGEERKEYSWDKKAALNPEDFVLRKMSGQTLVREPGTINGQSFVIEDCTDCDIFVCDFSSSVTVDNCINCKFFIGPVEDSIFVRECKSCKFIVACKQWRTRDCEEIDVLLYSKTQPIIESSNKMRFECFQYHYPALLEQFNNAKLNVLTNDWSNLYDFTPGEHHWTYLPKDEANISTFLKPLPAAILPEGSAHPSVVPPTWGNRSKPSPKSILVVFFGDHKDKVVEFCNAVTRDGAVIIQIIEKVISVDVLSGVDGSHLKMEVNGEEALAVTQKNSKYGPDVMFSSPSLEVAHEQIGKIFEQVSIDI